MGRKKKEIKVVVEAKKEVVKEKILAPKIKEISVSLGASNVKKEKVASEEEFDGRSFNDFGCWSDSPKKRFEISDLILQSDQTTNSWRDVESSVQDVFLSDDKKKKKKKGLYDTKTKGYETVKDAYTSAKDYDVGGRDDENFVRADDLNELQTDYWR